MSVVAGICVTATVVAGAWALGTSGAGGVAAFESLPSYLEIGPLAQPTTVFATESDGLDHALATFYAQNRLPVNLDQMSAAVSDAAIAAEDPRQLVAIGVELSYPSVAATFITVPRTWNSAFSNAWLLRLRWLKSVCTRPPELDVSSLTTCACAGAASTHTRPTPSKPRRAELVVRKLTRINRGGNSIVAADVEIAAFPGWTGNAALVFSISD